MQQDIKLPDEFREYLPEEVTSGIRIGLHTGSVGGGLDERFVWRYLFRRRQYGGAYESHGEPGKTMSASELNMP